MALFHLNRKVSTWLTFLTFFFICVAVGGFIFTQPASASQNAQGNQPESNAYAGSSSCQKCHPEIHGDWTVTRHAHAFSSPIFQQDWDELQHQTR